MAALHPAKLDVLGANKWNWSANAGINRELVRGRGEAAGQQQLRGTGRAVDFQFLDLDRVKRRRDPSSSDWFTHQRPHRGDGLPAQSGVST